MSNPTLVPCVHCARHVRTHESHCPFCEGVLPPVEQRALPRIPRGTSRAAAFALRAAVAAGSVGVVGATGCASDDCDPEQEACEGGPGEAGTGMEAGPPVADAQPVADAGPADARTDTAVWDSGNHDSGAQEDSGPSVPLPTDGGAADAMADAMADAAPDAMPADGGEDEDAFVPIPLYGGVFPDPRTRVKV